jgi:hypothetical protein
VGGVVAVGIAGEDLIDRLGEEGLGGVLDVLGGAGVGEPAGQLGNDTQGLLQGADGQQPGIGDDAAAIEGDVELLRADGPQGKVAVQVVGHDLEPPHGSKLLVKHSLDSA